MPGPYAARDPPNPGVQVDVKLYQRRRDMLYDALKEIGYTIKKPEGAFYLFPKCPIHDDVKFVYALLDKLIITTPGAAFYRQDISEFHTPFQNGSSGRRYRAFGKSLMKLQNKPWRRYE
jgi:aspartate/methionine/tyrosine aminotransferase